MSGFSFRSVLAYSVLVRREKGGGGGGRCVFVVRPKSSDLRCREYWIPGSDGYHGRYLIRSNPPPPPPHQKCNLWFTEYSVMSVDENFVMSVDENLVDHIPTYLAGEQLGEHMRTWGNIICKYWELCGNAMGTISLGARCS